MSTSIPHAVYLDYYRYTQQFGRWHHYYTQHLCDARVNSHDDTHITTPYSQQTATHPLIHAAVLISQGMRTQAEQLLDECSDSYNLPKVALQIHIQQQAKIKDKTLLHSLKGRLKQCSKSCNDNELFISTQLFFHMKDHAKAQQCIEKLLRKDSSNLYYLCYFTWLDCVYHHQHAHATHHVLNNTHTTQQQHESFTSPASTSHKNNTSPQEASSRNIKLLLKIHKKIARTSNNNSYCSPLDLEYLHIMSSLAIIHYYILNKQTNHALKHLMPILNSHPAFEPAQLLHLQLSQLDPSLSFKFITTPNIKNNHYVLQHECVQHLRDKYDVESIIPRVIAWFESLQRAEPSNPTLWYVAACWVGVLSQRSSQLLQISYNLLEKTLMIQHRIAPGDYALKSLCLMEQGRQLLDIEQCVHSSSTTLSFLSSSLDLFQEAMIMDETADLPIIWELLALIQRKQYDEADEKLNKMSKSTREASTFYFTYCQLHISFYHHGNFQQALQYFTETIDLHMSAVSDANILSPAYYRLLSSDVLESVGGICVQLKEHVADDSYQHVIVPFIAIITHFLTFMPSHLMLNQLLLQLYYIQDDFTNCRKTIQKLYSLQKNNSVASKYEKLLKLANAAYSPRAIKSALSTSSSFQFASSFPPPISPHSRSSDDDSLNELLNVDDAHDGINTSREERESAEQEIGAIEARLELVQQQRLEKEREKQRILDEGQKALMLQRTKLAEESVVEALKHRPRKRDVSNPVVSVDSPHPLSHSNSNSSISCTSHSQSFSNPLSRASSLSSANFMSGPPPTQFGAQNPLTISSKYRTLSNSNSGSAFLNTNQMPMSTSASTASLLSPAISNSSSAASLLPGSHQLSTCSSTASFHSPVLSTCSSTASLSAYSSINNAPLSPPSDPLSPSDSVNTRSLSHMSLKSPTPAYTIDGALSFLRRAESGATFYKHCTRGTAHERTIRMKLHDKQGWIVDWGTGKMELNHSQRQHVQVLAGKQTTVFDRKESARAKPHNCLSIVGPARSLDLEARNADIRDLWLDGIQMLLQFEEQIRDIQSHSLKSAWKTVHRTNAFQ